MAVLARYIFVEDTDCIKLLIDRFSEKENYTEAIDYLVNYLKMPTTLDDMDHYCKYLGYLRKSYELDNSDIQEYVKYLKETLK